LRKNLASIWSMTSETVHDPRETMKLKKKLREIEKIESKLAAGETVDPLQIKKVQSKTAVLEELTLRFDLPREVTSREPLDDPSVQEALGPEARTTSSSTADAEGVVPDRVARASQTSVSCRMHQAASLPGKEQRVRGFQRDRPAAGVVLLLGHGQRPEKVVITCQRRRGQPSWELPKGGLEDDDCANVEAAAAREFAEETGVTNDLVVLTRLDGYGNRRIHWFLARIFEERELMWGPRTDKDTLDAKCLILDDALGILRGDHKQLLIQVLKDIRRGSLRWP